MTEKECVVSIIETAQAAKMWIIDILYEHGIGHNRLTGEYLLEFSGSFIIGKNEVGIFESALTDLVMGHLVKEEMLNAEDSIEEVIYRLTPFGEARYYYNHKHDCSKDSYSDNDEDHKDDFHNFRGSVKKEVAFFLR